MTSPGFPAWLSGAGEEPGTWRAPGGGRGWRRAVLPGLTGPRPPPTLPRDPLWGRAGCPSCGKGAEEAGSEGRGAGGPARISPEVFNRPGVPQYLHILCKAGHRLPDTLVRLGPILDSGRLIRRGGGARGA